MPPTRMSEENDFQLNRPYTLFYYPSSKLRPRTMSENDVWTLWCLIDGKDRPFHLKANRNWAIAELADSVRERRSDLCAGINDIFLWKVSVLLVNENVPANFFSQVTKPSSVDPEEDFCDRFPCPIL